MFKQPKGLVVCEAQAASPLACLDMAVVVVIQIFNEFLFEVIHGLKLLQIQKFTFKQTEEVFYYSIVQVVTFSAHVLMDAFYLEFSLILLVLVLPDSQEWIINA